jgi:hypothetical protein
MRSLPYPVDPITGFPRLRYLELKRVDIDPHYLVKLIEDNARTLREVYLNEVYIKVFGSSELASTSLWIGYPDTPRAEECMWVADDLRKAREGGLKLDVLRVTGLGYDDFDPDRNSTHPNYDLDDPTGLNRSFDQRFVEAVFGIDDVVVNDAPYIPRPLPHLQSQLLPDSDGISLALVADPLTSYSPPAPRVIPPSSPLSRVSQYDAATYQRRRNTTSQYKRCIDGYFFNHNEQALKELQKIITVADRSVAMIGYAINRAYRVRINAAAGNLEQPSDVNMSAPAT